MSPIPAFATFDKFLTPSRELSFHNYHTDEELNVCYFCDGEYDAAALQKIDYILRDHRTGETKSINTNLLDLLYAVAVKSKCRSPFFVISGYRSRATNAMLRKKRKGVAAKSLHMEGKAIDLRIPRYSTRRLRKIAVSLKGGGVGYYPRSNFVHLDIGPVRFW
jgi:uncharacterized protein YcbK (DUF882 family)